MKFLPKKIMPIFILCAEFFISVALAIVTAIIGFVIGVTLGGNGYVVIPYAGLAGYESLGMLGSLTGAWLGALLGCWLIAWRQGNPVFTWRSLVYTACVGWVLMLFIFSFSVPKPFPKSEETIVLEWFMLFFFPTIWIALGRRLVYFYAQLFRHVK